MARQDTTATGGGPAVPDVTVNLHQGASEHVRSHLCEHAARRGKVLGCLELGVVQITTSSAAEMRTLAHEAMRLTYVLEQAEIVHANDEASRLSGAQCPTVSVNFHGTPVRCSLPQGHGEACGGARGGKWVSDPASAVSS